MLKVAWWHETTFYQFLNCWLYCIILKVQLLRAIQVNKGHLRTISWVQGLEGLVTVAAQPHMVHLPQDGEGTQVKHKVHTLPGVLDLGVQGVIARAHSGVKLLIGVGAIWEGIRLNFHISFLVILSLSCCQKIRRISCILWTFNPFPKKPWFSRVCNTSVENTVEKGEIDHYEQFLLFSQCFLPFWRTLCQFYQIEDWCLQILSIWRV